MEHFYEFGPARVRFRDFPRNGSWPFWEWKAEPWTAAAGDAHLEVLYEPKRFAKAGEMMHEECTPSCHRAYFIQPDGGLLWQHTDLPSGRVQLQMVLEADGTHLYLTRDETQTCGLASFEALTFLMFYAFLSRGVLTLHGALVEQEGRGFCICAPSGMGKTTHARLWRDHRNALILNSDRTTCFLDGKQWIAFGTPWCGTGGEAINRKVPLVAVVILNRGKCDRVSPATGEALLNLVLPNLAYPVRTEATTLLMLELLDRLLDQVPVLRMECMPRESAVEALENALKEYGYAKD